MLYKRIVLLHGNPLAMHYCCTDSPFCDRSIVLFQTANKMLINLPNGIGKIKNTGHACMRTRPVYHRSFKPFEYFIAKGSKAKLNIRPGPKINVH